MPAKTNTEIRQRQPTDSWVEFDRLFDDLRGRFYDSFGFAPAFGPSGIIQPTRGGPLFRAAAADVTDTGKGYKVVAELPGVKKDQVEIRVRGPYVEIRTEQQEESEKKEAGYLRHERTYQGFYRALELPESVVAAEAKAKLENGVLELELPKEHPSVSDEVKVPVQ